MKHTGASRIANYNDVSAKTIPNKGRKRIRHKKINNKTDNYEAFSLVISANVLIILANILIILISIFIK
jgi:hypothetical protein